MRLWSLHPQYLDVKGLVAQWREGLLAQAVLAGKTKGYRNHPQLHRFIQTAAPEDYIASYLRQIFAEAVRRGYHFDETKIPRRGPVSQMQVTSGQLDYEWLHLQAKLTTRAPAWVKQFKSVTQPDPHPIFHIISGGMAQWEIIPP